MIAQLPHPVLNLAPGALQDIDGGDALSSLWIVFSKCKDTIEDGGRLENISWRLWYRELAAGHAHPCTSKPEARHHHQHNLLQPRANTGFPFPPAYTDASHAPAHASRPPSLSSSPSCSSASSAPPSPAQAPADDRPHVARTTSTSSIGKIICDMLPEKLAIASPLHPSPSPRNLHPGVVVKAISNSAPTPAVKAPSPAPSPAAKVSGPAVTTNSSPAAKASPRPSPSVAVPRASPSGPTSQPQSLLGPRVVVVNPTPHPTPPATPLQELPRPPFVAPQPLPLARAPLPTPEAEPTRSVAVQVASATIPIGTVPKGVAPDTHSASVSFKARPYLGPDRRFFLQQSPDEDSPERAPEAGSLTSVSSRATDDNEVTAKMQQVVKRERERVDGERVDKERKERVEGERAEMREREKVEKEKEKRPAMVRGRTAKGAVKRAVRPGLARQNTGSRQGEREKGEAKKAFKIGSTSSAGSKQSEAPVVAVKEVKGREVLAKGKEKELGLKVGSKGKGKGREQSSEWASESEGEGEGESWESESDAAPAKKESKREREAREKEEKEEREREMFAKLPKRSYSGLTRTGSGLLSMLLNPDPRMLPPNHPYAPRQGADPDSRRVSGGVPQLADPRDERQGVRSSEDVAGMRERRLGPMARRGLGMTAVVPPASGAGGKTGSQPPTPTVAAASTKASSSTSKAPSTTSKALSRAPSITSTKAPSIASASPTSGLAPSKSAAALPVISAFRPPAGLEMESEEEDDDEEGVVSKSLAQRKLEALADGQRRRQEAKEPQPHHPLHQRPQHQQPPQRSQQQPAQRSQQIGPAPVAVPLPVGHPYNLPAPAAPTTPRTTRRQMLSTELSESLRRNLLWERQVSRIGVRKRVVQRAGSGDERERGEEDEEARKKAALARNRSWADDYHYAGW